ncbi:MAG: preprotein translocase subunit YajC [Candidatus Aureabacteria bacterium]|nr:preprotein translocase subunit YajC [Candidatus Auribacterota bacterium]
MDFIKILELSLAAAPQVQRRPSLSEQLVYMLPMFGIMFFILYLFIWKPQQKKQKEHQTMLDSMTKGDKVVTIGGIHGVLIGEKNNIAVIKISENTKIEINKSAIASVEKK